MQEREIRNTVFGEVLVGLVEERGLPASPFVVETLAGWAGLDNSGVLDRMVDPDADVAGHLDKLARDLDLAEAERMRLAVAFAFEERAEGHAERMGG
jgi:hypothetical protein